MRKILALLLVTFLALQACKKDQGPQEPEDNNSPVSFSNDIQPIFNQNCTSCHPNSGNLDLRAGQSYNNLVNVQAGGYPALRVKPGDPEHSVLYKKIDGSGAYGSNMPLGGSLTSTQKNLIKTWIEQGALNN